MGTLALPTTYCVVDIETTGFDPQRDMIYEIASVSVRNGRIISTLSTLVAPACNLLVLAPECSFLDLQAIQQAPSIEIALGMLLSFVYDLPLVGHNIQFDLRFINYACLLHGLHQIENDWIDTLALARKILTHEQHYRLEDVACSLHVPSSPAHHALGDALTTVAVYNRLKELNK